MPVQISFS